MTIKQLENTDKPSKLSIKILIRTTICLLILLMGFAGMSMLTAMKKPPAVAQHKEAFLKVETVKAVLEDVSVMITGYGEVKALNYVSIAPEVSGKIIEVHPSLEVGKIIKKGAILFKIDPLNYKAGFLTAQADVHQSENMIVRLKKEYQIDKKRIATLKRSRDLAKNEFNRKKKLLKKSKIGTISGVEGAERDYNLTSDQYDQLDQKVLLYPIRIKEADNILASAMARLMKAKADLNRCTILAPFQCRIKNVSIEKGQYVAPGINIITLADDSILEILVSLDSNEVRKWLQFSDANHNNKIDGNSSAWFTKLKHVNCLISWTEDKNKHTFQGKLDRVVNISSKTRSIIVAINIDAKDAVKNNNTLPLVEGMFCRVMIPGITIKNVIRLPVSAVGFDNTVFINSDNRLKTNSVQVAWIDGKDAFIKEGISINDTVIITRLIDPLENSLLDASLISSKKNM